MPVQLPTVEDRGDGEPSTILSQLARMPDEHIRLAFRTADQARTDFAIIEDELEAIMLA